MHLAFNFGQNSKDWIDVLGALGPLLIGILSIGLSIFSYKLSQRNLKEQKQQFDKQLQIQATQWKSDAILQHKIKILLDLQKYFLKFKKETIFFIRIFLPDGITRKDRTLNSIDYFDISTDDSIPFFINTKYYDSFEYIIQNNLKTANELLNILENNDFFIQPQKNIKTELKDFVKSFLDLYVNLILNKDLLNNVLIEKAPNVYEVSFNPAFNEHFFKFMHYRLPFVTDENVRTHVFFMDKGSIFSENKLTYNDDNIKMWARNCKILHYVSHTISRWLTITHKNIDDLLLKYVPNIDESID